MRAPQQQHTPFDRLDEVAPRPQLVPAAQVEAPGFGGPQRDAIASIVDGVVSDVIANIQALQKQLKALEDHVLVSAANAKAALTAQVEVCARVREETANIGEIVKDIAQKALRV